MLRGGIIADAIQRLDQHPCAGNLHARNRAIALIGDMVRICQHDERTPLSLQASARAEYML